MSSASLPRYIFRVVINGGFQCETRHAGVLSSRLVVEGGGDGGAVVLGAAAQVKWSVWRGRLVEAAWQRVLGGSAGC